MKLFKHKLYILLFSFALITQVYSIVSYASIQFDKNEINNSLNAYSESSLFSDASVCLNSDELEVLTLINNHRVANNQTSLIPLNPLQNVAYEKAYDLVNSNYFSHTSPNFGSTFSLLEKQDILYNIAGENLAGNISADMAVKAWIDSPSHRENILTGEFIYTGIAIVDSEQYGKIFVQIFIG